MQSGELNYGWWACRIERDLQQFWLLSKRQSTARPIVQAGRETGTEAVSQQLPMDYRQIGQALASHINQSSGVTTGAALQGMIADLAADHPELQLPMRDLVSRPAFQLLIAKANSGGGMLQRDALINEVRPLFSAPVLEALSELLNGFLNLPSPTNQHQAAAEREEWNRQSPPSPPPQGTAIAAAVDTPAAGESRGHMLTLALVVAGLVAGAGVALRSPALCGYVGLCADSKGAEEGVQILAAASRADQAMRRASTLTNYRTALEQLDSELLKLSKVSLSETQQQQRDELSASAKQAQTVLTAEEVDQQRVEKAAAALQSAQQQGGAGRSAQLAVASKELAAIPPRSFAATDASRLRKEMAQLEQAEAAARAPTGTSIPEARSAPYAPPTPQDSAPEPAPYRDQPLF